MNFDPFSFDLLTPMFRLEKEGSYRLKSRENSGLEYKESFNWANKNDYAKTIASFANARGGYLVFGVTNKPRTIKGLQNDNFEDIDPAEITQYLSSYLSPEIKWEHQIYELENRKIGIIYIFESHMKPVICSKAAGALNEGAIYYRYRGQSKAIRYPELRMILDEQRRKDQDAILIHLKKITQVGVESVAILNTMSGEIQGPGGRLMLDESLLSKISFIKEGHFAENHSMPALKLIGQIESVNPGFLQPIKTLTKSKAIRSSDIVLTFLEGKDIPDPLEYIKQICFESTAYLPVKYYIKKLGKPLSDVLPSIESVHSRNQSKKTLIKRLSSLEDLSLRMPSVLSPAFEKKDQYVQQFKKNIYKIPENDDDLRFSLQAIRTLGKLEVDKRLMFKFLRQIFEKYYSDARGPIADHIRKAICYMDNIFYG